MAVFAALVATPARQAALWAAMGIAGVSFAAGGVYLMTAPADPAPVRASSRQTPESSVSSSPVPSAPAAAAEPSPSPSGGPSPSPSPSPTPAATPTPMPSPVATTRPAAAVQAPVATPTPTPEPAAAPSPEPTVAAVAPGGPYCNNVSSSAPPNSVIGLLTIGGQPAPAGTQVTLTFDGIAGPGRATAEAGGYKVNWSAGGGECANRVGAAIGVVVNGAVFATGTAVGGGDGTPVIRFDIAVP